MSITSEISRRLFIGGVAAFGSSSLFMPALCLESEDEPLIRFGVASDVHIFADWRDANCRDLDRQPEYIEKALRWFDSQRADAVVFAGDMAHTGQVAELERLAAVWEKAFPGGRAADGRNVPLLLQFGDEHAVPRLEPRLAGCAAGLSAFHRRHERRGRREEREVRDARYGHGGGTWFPVNMDKSGGFALILTKAGTAAQ